MLDLNDIALLSVISVIISTITGVLVGIVSMNIRDRRVTDLEIQVKSMEMRFLSERGRAANSQKRERMDSAMAEAAIMFQSGKKPDEIMKEMLAKYPDLALDMVKKGL